MDYISFSVLLSLYNKEKENNLDTCLKSLYEQSLKPEQVVIVFDGYIDEGLRAVVSKYSEILPISTVPLEKNVGLGNALNIGMKYCRNEIVARMDTDDICCSDRFIKQISYINENPDIAIVGSMIDEYNEDFSIRLGRRITVCEHEDIVGYAKKRNPFNHMTVVFRKSFILSVGGYRHHLYMEDYNLWLRVLSTGKKTYNFKESLVKVRTGTSMLKRRKGIPYILSEFKLAKLKYALGYQGIGGAIGVLFIRSLPRLLPVNILTAVYNTLRTKR
ncbi:glycosyltransferase [Jejubacter calystegiae]|uniref:Glycosyltransferase n=1 Tax=Jejubacter calystegiae TaxID=2579935 RepID=A0A4V1G861_9ENTR|nr:glycosyltransferase [Jejubacter calystegiae]QCT22027.1 glycosyltransferase [Jejubacter calystegiae]